MSWIFLKSLLEFPGNLLEICLVKFVGTLVSAVKTLSVDIVFLCHPVVCHNSLVVTECFATIRRRRPFVRFTYVAVHSFEPLVPTFSPILNFFIVIFKFRFSFQ